jgi:D-alanine-D-alanine ligase
VSKKIRLGILFGGRSGEHDVSLRSAASVIRALDPAKYEIVPIGVTREGHWRVGYGATTSLPQVLESGASIIPSADPTGPGLLSAAPSNAAASLPAPIDVIFPVLHGTFGEDGTVQGLLDLADIPYVGAGVLGSAVGMDKDVMKRLFRDARLPVVPWELVLRGDWNKNPGAVRKRIEAKLRYPLFVKPVNLGSSVGISKVHHRRELAGAINLAALYDRKVLVENGINAREIECSVLGNDHPQASLPGEVIPINEFYDYEAKYLKEGSELRIPAPLTPQQTRRVQELAVRSFQAIDGAGMARVDFLLDRKTGRVYVNEINTIPGFTSISMYPKMWEASGVPYTELLDRLIELALERHREKCHTRFTYSPKARR